jgi:adenylosuccinate synthase
MAVRVVVGAQWGDEGKGKVVETLDGDINARYNGGANAGHTLDDFIAHLLPSSISNPNILSVLGNGVVIDPWKLIPEIEAARARNYSVTPKQFKISKDAFITFPHHIYFDVLTDWTNPLGRIGSTGNGIGPTYAGQASKTGLKLEHLGNDKLLSEYLEWIKISGSGIFTEQDKAKLAKFYKERLNVYFSDKEGLNTGLIKDKYKQAWEKIQPFVDDTVTYLNNALKEGKKITAEGAQGLLLDKDKGISYPFTTSSLTGPDGVAPGLGVPEESITDKIAIIKILHSRVGNGPFPTELVDEKISALSTRMPDKEREIFLQATKDLIRSGRATSKEIDRYLREYGNGEYGATTGRPRRIGNLDLFIIKDALEKHSVKTVGLTKLDAFDGWPSIKVRVRDGLDESSYEYWPAPVNSYNSNNWDSLDSNAKKFVLKVEEYLQRNVKYIGTGPRKDALIIKG